MKTNEIEKVLPPDVEGWAKVRYLVAFISWWAFLCNYALRININLAIVEMVNPVSSNVTKSVNEECGRPADYYETDASKLHFSNGTDLEEVEKAGSVKFDWDERIQSMVLGSVFIGYITTQLLGGILAERLGGKLVLGIPLFTAGLLSMLTPLAAKTLDYGAVIALRILLGMAEGVTFPAMHAILANWCPPLERSKMSSIVYAGSAFGTIVTLASGGLMMHAWGWESIYYFFGALTTLWFIFWMIFVSDTPMSHRLISEQEKTYIMATLSSEDKKTSSPIPWRGILTSYNFWALLMAHAGNNLGYWMLLTQLPTYMKNILHFKIQQNGLLSSLPFVLLFTWSLLYGYVMDVLRTKKWMSTTNVRKLANFFAQGGSGLCLIGAAYVGCDRTTTVALFCIAGLCQGCVFSGYMANHLDLAPNFAGTLMGLTNTAATVTSWIAPVLTGAITANNQTISAWRTVFWICAVVMLFDAIEFVIFGSGDEQPWNRPVLHENPSLANIVDEDQATPGAAASEDAEECRRRKSTYRETGFDNPAYRKEAREREIV